MKTAVEWLFSQLPEEYTSTRNGFDVYQIAKEMEKEQIMDAYWDGGQDVPLTIKTCEIYYNNNFIEINKL
jgi:hypothetical protein